MMTLLAPCIKRTSVHNQNICSVISSVNIRFEILLWLSGAKTIRGLPLRKGALGRVD